MRMKRAYALACSAGSYSLTGTDATLSAQFHYTLSLEAGIYSLTGTNAGLTSARTMACNAGSYTLTGTNADFYRALVMACEAGSYALTGTDVTFTIQPGYTEVYPLTLKAVTSADFAVTMPQVITMATYAELST